MRTYTINLSFALVTLLTLANLSFGQDPEPALNSDSLALQPFESTKITEAFSLSGSLILEAGRKHFSDADLFAYAAEVDSLQRAILQLEGDSILANLNEIDVKELNLTMENADYFLDLLQERQDRLSVKAAELKASSEELSHLIRRWELTRETIPEEEITEERLSRIASVSDQLDSVRILILADMGRILGEEDRLADAMNELQRLKTEVSEQVEFLGEHLFSRDMPGLLYHLTNSQDSAMFRKHISQIQSSFKRDMAIMKSDFKWQMIGAGLFLMLLMGFTYWFMRSYRKLILTRKFKVSKIHLAIIHSPVMVSVFVTGAMVRFIFPHLPGAFHSLNFVIFMVPMFILVSRIFGKNVIRWFLILIVLYTLTFFYELTYDSDILLRIIMLIFSLTALYLFVWMFVSKSMSFQFSNMLVYSLLRLLLLVFNILLIIAVVANMVGAFSLAEFFTLMPIQIVLLALGVQLATKIVDAMVFLFLASKNIQRFNVVKDGFQTIYKRTSWILDLLLWIFFFSLALSIFRIRDSFVEWGGAFMTNAIKVGAAEITLWSVVLFFLVIWFSIEVTRIIRNILEKDVFSRVSTAKGVPTTVVLLVRVSLLAGGFLFAAAAAGIQITSLSIVIGAFSVGIGFGLQNIFNNLVSGLILAIERPINVGDVVQVGELIGVVKSISMRSSNVKSFDGAEVIVPNGNLISNELINWTLSDSNRRIDIRVGVAYGTKPGEVVKLLQQVAEDHEKIDKEPPAMAYFIGFGESSLDFRLLAWTNIDGRLQVESELNMAVNDALKQKGIEIPFPQRDLHIRSDATRKTK